jgi:hypothetical protein
MIEIQNKKETVTYQSVHVSENYNLEQNQKVVKIWDKEWYAIYAYISENWDVAEGAPSIISARVHFVSILKNGKAGNNYKTEQWVGKTSYEGAFKELFEAYEQELAKVTQEVAVA